VAVRLAVRLTAAVLVVAARTAVALVRLVLRVRVMLVVMVVSEAAAGVAVLVQQVALRPALIQGVMGATALRQASQAHQ
jgi:hypothetical protein